MQNKVVAEAVRIEYQETTGELYIVFKVIDPFYKQDLKKNWINDIEFKLIDKQLIKENE